MADSAVMDRWLLTPYLLDQEDRGLTALAREGWETNRPELRGQTQGASSLGGC